MRSLRALLPTLAARLVGTALGLALAWQVAAGAPTLKASASPAWKATLAFAVSSPSTANVVLTLQP